ncbi:DUF3108 domain-containing protein [Rhodoferax sp.]|uniref:DUF3108 domain-containing protein n=1 Tax=Rhodoferax sp. TaxID=50421 RepID=UPI003BB6AEE8|nr:DUF3108 domain-containing protein [Rhodoferax sp.]
MTLRTWLSLTLAVSLAHLVLLQTLPLERPMTNTPSSPVLATRTVLLTRTPTPSAAQVAAIRQNQAKTPAARTPVRKPVAQAALVSESTVSNTDPAPLVSADPDATDPDATDLQTQAGPMAETPASAASAPAVAAIDPARASESAAAPPATNAASAVTPEADPPLASTEVAFHAESLPASVKLMYRVEANKFPYTLNAEFSWQLQGQSYQAQLRISTFGQTRVQTSRGQIDPFGLAPDRFSDKYRSEVAVHFNRAQGLVSFSANTPSIRLQPGAQDRLSVLVQLAALVASAPQSFGPGTTLQVQTIGPRNGDLWLFTFGDLETLDLPGGPLQGLKLMRQPRQPYDQKLEVWLSPELGYLPARVRITEANGNYVDQKWLASQAADSP